MKIDLVPGAIPYKSRVRQFNPDQKENLGDQIDKPVIKFEVGVNEIQHIQHSLI